MKIFICWLSRAGVPMLLATVYHLAVFEDFAITPNAGGGSVGYGISLWRCGGLEALEWAV